MKELVINKNYELQLPNSFVDVEREEMEYVDGGMYVSEHWWGIAVDLNVDECKQMAIELRASAYTSTIGETMLKYVKYATGVLLACDKSMKGAAAQLDRAVSYNRGATVSIIGGNYYTAKMW